MKDVPEGLGALLGPDTPFRKPKRGELMRSHRLQIVVAVVVLTTISSARAQFDDESTGSEFGLDEMAAGWYASISGMSVLQLDADTTIAGLGSPEISFNDGLGLTAAFGQTCAEWPLSIELEFSFRTADTDRLRASGGFLDFDGDFNTHAIMVNAMLNHQFEGSRFGVYGGAGIGVAHTLLQVDTVGGMPVGVNEEDITFAYQVMGGASFRLMPDTILYAGARWFDALEPEFTGVPIANNSVDFEIGVRFYF